MSRQLGFRVFSLNISKMVQLIFSQTYVILWGIIYSIFLNEKNEDMSFIVGMVTNSRGSAGLKIMITNEKSDIFLKILNGYGIFELRFEIRSP